MEEVTKTAYSMILVKDTLTKAKLCGKIMGYKGQWVGDWVNCKETRKFIVVDCGSGYLTLYPIRFLQLYSKKYASYCENYVLIKN